MSDLSRYSLIGEKFPREMVLLLGTGCKHKKCAFCDYYLDFSPQPFSVNKAVLEKVSGKFGVLDVINSGSCFELDDATLNFIYIIAKKNNIHTIWFETHYMYRKKLTEFRNRFSGINLKFRCGVETFDPDLRNKWNKGIPVDVLPSDIAHFFDGICLIVGVEGQTEEGIKSDIKIATDLFEYTSINVFNENSTNVKPDSTLIEWFTLNVYPKIKNFSNLEILLNNTDLGVG